ncbi:Electron transport complex protein RnfG [uncultured Gammaproteobacteria bacterium]|uniref:electron transport complex subunit RsxG n=1 Tax=Bathymodiolus heckerae thiotrophic gill symbiont TaxID=1052212 RepID=UPI0010B2F8D0|nr:electron transport complex subunit RsxG [Bathymodiolus heckerae thiotrophic gill symbiont]CAC9446680.1 Electron transport complex protein RnfG [uncultured Gammaproteobacteria bacterium]SMN14008.1 Electron transport complex protein RnfG [Bathymodiolus heckerae thiotrophic gill symbiont]
MKLQPIFKAGILLFTFTAISIFFVSMVQDSTQERIKYNERQLLIQRLGELVTSYDNNILQDKFFKKTMLHGIEQTLTIYPAKNNNQTFAYLIEHTYPNGYSGSIRLLTGVGVDKKLLGVRVIAHKETPGLGDKIETQKSDWIKQFLGLSLSNPTKQNWKVKQDGGIFDAFTGATVTPRAIVTATYQVLELFSKPCLFNEKPCN